MVIICGYKKRAGKDQFFQFLKELLPEKKIYRVAFADALKEEIDEMVLKPFGLPIDVLEDDDTKPIMRTLLQWWGTEFRRSTNPKLKGDPDHWINLAHKKIEDFYEQNPDCVIVICDGRFPNEYIATKQKFSNTVSLLIERNNSNQDAHSSENIMSEHLHLYDYKIDNNGSLNDFKQKVQNFVNEYFHE